MHTQSNTSNSLLNIKDLMFIVKLIRKNILILIFLPLMSYTIGYLYAHRLPNVYGAKTQLLLKSNETYDYQDPIYKGLGAYGIYMDVRNQIRILQSRDIMQEVIHRTDLNTSYYVVGRLKKQEVFGTLPFSAQTKEMYAPEWIYENPIDITVTDYHNYELFYEIQGTSKSYKGIFGEELITEEARFLLKKNYAFTQENIERIKSSDYQVIFHSENHMISHFQSRMGIENVEHTSILEVHVTDDIGARAKVFLDTLAAVFIEYSQKNQLEINENTLKNIEKQIEEVKKILVAIEQELLSYKDDHDIISPNKEAETYYEMYVEYSRSKRDIDGKIKSLELLKEYVENDPDDHLLPPSLYFLEEDDLLKEKVNEFYNLQLQKTEMIYNFSENHPEVRKLEDELVVMRKDMLDYLRNLKTALNIELDQNEIMIGKYKNSVQDIPRSLQGIENITRELDVNNKMYLFLLEKKTNTLIARAGIIPQVQIVEKPSLSGVLGPNKSKIRNMFLLGGFILALLIAFIRKLFFERIENVQELEELTSIPVMAGISYLKDVENPLIVNSNPKSQVTESFRVLRSNVSFLGEKKAGSRATKILISSFFPGEGKTFCSTNLATILSMAENKVLVVDFDLHKPKIHKSFNLENEKGISNYLIGKCEYEEILHKGSLPNLDVITSGPVPPNPSELILRKRLYEFVEKVEKEFDYVIFDTPPFGLLNDSLELVNHADVFLAVVNSRLARSRGIYAVEKMLEKYGGISKGFILNGIRQTRLGYYYNKYAYKYNYRYSYGMGYGYGYGYGYDEGDDGRQVKDSDQK